MAVYIEKKGSLIIVWFYILKTAKSRSIHVLSGLKTGAILYEHQYYVICKKKKKKKKVIDPTHLSANETTTCMSPAMP